MTIEKESENIEKLKQAEQSEIEISPEDLERTMEKIQNINQKGTAFTVVSENRKETTFDRIFKEGLLGSRYGEPEEIEKSNPKESIKKAREKFIFFNILGRGLGEPKTTPDLKDSLRKGVRGSEFTLLLNLSKLTEDIPSDRGYRYQEIKQPSIIKPNTYWAEWNLRTYIEPPGHISEKDFSYESWKKSFGDLKPGDPRIKECPNYKFAKDRFIDENGWPIVSQIYGFATTGRIAPRFIKGIVIRDPNEKERILAKMLSSQKDCPKKNFIPIYDLEGNLLWPKKMSYQEVKEFTAKNI